MIALSIALLIAYWLSILVCDQAAMQLSMQDVSTVMQPAQVRIVECAVVGGCLAHRGQATLHLQLNREYLYIYITYHKYEYQYVYI